MCDASTYRYPSVGFGVGQANGASSAGFRTVPELSRIIRAPAKKLKILDGATLTISGGDGRKRMNWIRHRSQQEDCRDASRAFHKVLLLSPSHFIRLRQAENDSIRTSK
jgi:hypothetical protein